METLKELREQIYALDQQRLGLYRKISKLEEKEILKCFKVGECYIDADCWDYPVAFKIIFISGKEIHFAKLEETMIGKGDTTLKRTENWTKITTEQFNALRDAVLSYIQNPNWGTMEKSAWEEVVQPIIKSIYPDYNPT